MDEQREVLYAFEDEFREEKDRVVDALDEVLKVEYPERIAYKAEAIIEESSLPNEAKAFMSHKVREFIKVFVAQRDKPDGPSPKGHDCRYCGWGMNRGERCPNCGRYG